MLTERSQEKLSLSVDKNDEQGKDKPYVLSYR